LGWLLFRHSSFRHSSFIRGFGFRHSDFHGSASRWHTLPPSRTLPLRLFETGFGRAVGL
jgi:hypothetical protein